MSAKKEHEPIATERSKGLTLTPRLIGGGVVAALVLIVLVQNSQSVTVSLFGWELSMPLWLLLLITFVLGMLLDGLVMSGIRRLRRKDPK